MEQFNLRQALGLLGLCARASRLVSGEGTCELTLRKGDAKLVLIDSGASNNTKKKFLDACAFRNVPYRMLPEDELGKAIGKNSRMVAVITDISFSLKLIDLLKNTN